MNAIALTDNELLELEDCERTVEFGVGMLIASGRALSKIRDKRLYRQHYSNWQDYITARWSHLFEDYNSADRLITFAAVYDHLLPFGSKIEHESHAREIAKYAPDIWQATANVAITAAEIEGKSVTASHFKYAGQEVSEMLTVMSQPTDRVDDARIKEMAVNVVEQRVESTKQRIQRDNPNQPTYKELIEFVKRVAALTPSDYDDGEGRYEPASLTLVRALVTEAHNIVGTGE